MQSMSIRKKRIQKLPNLNGFDLKQIQIGIPVENDEDKKIGLHNIGDIVLPAPIFGSNSRRNACGYEYPDKSKSKERRYVSTVWIQPFGNKDADYVAVDIYRLCYPKVFVLPICIEFILYENKKSNKFILANLTTEIKKDNLINVINLFLEIFGVCYVFDGDIEVQALRKKHRCNWEILPPGEKPSQHIIKQRKNAGLSHNTFEVDRLQTLEKYSVEKIVEGVNGFNGYYAYIFKNICVLESANYGNATYIIPRENWEIFSQKTKKELMDINVVLQKIIHNSNWTNDIRNAISKFEH